MKPDMKPLGITIEIRYEDRMYFGHLYNDWDRFKTIGNQDINPEEELILFDEDFNRIGYDDELYDILTPLVVEYLAN